MAEQRQKDNIKNSVTSEKPFMVDFEDIPGLTADDINNLVQKLKLDQLEIEAQVEELKNSQKELRENEEYFRRMFDSALAGIMVIDAENFTIIDINNMAVKMIGYEKSHIVGNVCHNFVCPAEKGKCPVIDLAQNIDNSERTLVSMTGPKDILKSVVPILRNGKKQLLEIIIDNTERKKVGLVI